MTPPRSESTTRGLLDTSVVIDLERVPVEALPAEPCVSALTMAELAAGPHATDDPAERARRQDRLQRLETTLDPIPFDAAAARAYGRVYAATRALDRKPRGSCRGSDDRVRRVGQRAPALHTESRRLPAPRGRRASARIRLKRRERDVAP